MRSNIQAGFTLIEILIAMSIFALIGLASVQMLTTVINSNELSDERFQSLQTLQRTMLLIERDFLQIVPRKARLNGETVDIVLRGGENEFQSDADGIGFVRSGWHNPKLILRRSTLQSVIYRLQDKELQRIHTLYVDTTLGSEPIVRPIMKDVNDLQFEFLVKPESGRPEWKDSYKGNTLPRAVAVIIDTQTYGKIRREFLVGV